MKLSLESLFSKKKKSEKYVLELMATGMAAFSLDLINLIKKKEYIEKGADFPQVMNYLNSFFPVVFLSASGMLLGLNRYSSVAIATAAGIGAEVLQYFHLVGGFYDPKDMAASLIAGGFSLYFTKDSSEKKNAKV